jgi:hypothetical protein
MRAAACALVLTATAAQAQAVADATGAILRGLDKVAGTTVDMALQNGETAAFGSLAITLAECRYPADNPAADAYANLDVLDQGGNLIFGGWMVASSPALSALDHPRYDVWVLGCIVPEPPPAAPEEGETSSDG